MTRLARFLAFAVALAFVAPTAVATWYGYGDFEPNSVYDDANFQWTEPPTYGTDAGAGTKRIYFNAYPTMYPGSNPNVGAIESQYMYPAVSWYAALGVWVDCNGDGYIGLAESALDEYRNELLTDKSRCPAGKSDHNKDGWVLELLPIGRTTLGNDKRIINDKDVVMWGDIGRPFATGDRTEGGSCALSPLPKGTLHRTGAFLDYADCRSGHEAAQTWNALVLTLDPTNSNGLALQDTDRWDQAGHPLNVDTFGEDHADNSYIHAQDCSQAPLVDLTPLPGADFDDKGPRPLRPGGPSVNPSGNIPGTVNRTYEDNVEDCNTENDWGHDFYTLESEFNGVSATEKTEADMNFNYSMQPRGGIPLGFPTFGPPYGGITLLEHGMRNANNMWSSNQVTTTSHLTTVRDDLTPEPARFWTFYVTLGSTSFLAGSTPGSSAVYGARFCPNGYGTGAGIHGGWQCDANLWNRNPSDGSEKTRYFTLAVPGMTYHLRDVDCFDGSVTPGVPIGVSPASISERTCDSPAE